MELKEDRWFLRTEGHTLGPFTAADIHARIKTGEILAEDRICSARDPRWQEVQEHAEFRATLEASKASDALELPPSPSILWKKKKSFLAKVKSLPPELSAARAAPLASSPVAPPKLAAPATPTPQLPPPSVVSSPPIAKEITTQVQPKKRGRKPGSKNKQDVIHIAAEPAKTEAPAQKSLPLPPLALRSEFSAFNPQKIAPLGASLAPLGKVEQGESSDLQLSREVNRSLTEALRAWSLEESRSASSAPPPAFRLEEPKRDPIPAAPVMPERFGSTEFKPEKEQLKRSESRAENKSRVIQIELKVPSASALWPKTKAAWAAVVLVLTILVYVYTQNKTRDLKDSHLPDPPSPTTVLPTGGDPNPPLKAPTRPQRD